MFIQEVFNLKVSLVQFRVSGKRAEHLIVVSEKINILSVEILRTKPGDKFKIIKSKTLQWILQVHTRFSVIILFLKNIKTQADKIRAA